MCYLHNSFTGSNLFKHKAYAPSAVDIRHSLWIGLIPPIKLKKVAPQKKDSHEQQGNQCANDCKNRPRREIINKGYNDTHTGH